eukprot:CAMPEP_0176452118 /NCGR_PEP_ID=MMETSP0127-20121128/28314_1 /TAXON_ID=938130 /ORGANISM="Platyophrya macrostoma, Strain WH" /LENGTH=594 /DNA_ID=CAMNT_0017840449 /DNA_START=44 /DNA_END=1828 /DNA_ORIENTATION=+
MVEPVQKAALKNVQKLVKKVFTETIQKRFNITDEAVVLPITNIPGSDYQIPTATKLFHSYKKTQNSFGFASAEELAKEIVKSLAPNDVIEQVQLNDKGFLVAQVSQKFLEKEITTLVKEGVVFRAEKPTVVAVDFSSPNIAKEMHVGHLRSTIIGESICRVLEFLGHDVKRINHVGDWGTQFGMLIAHMQDVFPDFMEKQPQLSDLESFYVAAKKKFEEDEAFKKRSQLNVVSLQSGNEDSLKAWKICCDLSRAEFEKIYKRLDITVYECGESYYNAMIPDVVKELEEKGLVKLDKGAKCIFIPGKQQPLIAVKSDGGYNYDSTDLAAIRYRIYELKAERLIYITDAGQFPHFELIFKAAEMAKWLEKPKVAEHMGFGFVLRGDGGKFKTSEGNTVKLLSLLDEAKDRAKKQIIKRMEEHKEGSTTNIDEKDLEKSAEQIGMAAIKYFDLRQNRISNYKFDYDQMLDPKGNTAVYLLYAYARLCSIIRKSGMTEAEIEKAVNSTGFKITHEHEAVLATCILRFPETIEMAVDELALHKITDFLYDIAVKVAEGYNKYKIVGDENQTTRILLCEAIRKIMKQAFYLVGIEPLDKI